MNLRPLGYEPSELPNCSTPRPRASAIISNLAFPGQAHHNVSQAAIVSAAWAAVHAFPLYRLCEEVTVTVANLDGHPARARSAMAWYRWTPPWTNSPSVISTLW